MEIMDALGMLYIYIWEWHIKLAGVLYVSDIVGRVREIDVGNVDWMELVQVQVWKFVLAVVQLWVLVQEI